MLKIITATHRLFFSKNINYFNLIVFCKISGGADFEGTLILKLFHS